MIKGYILLHRMRKVRYKLIRHKIIFEALYRYPGVNTMPNGFMMPTFHLVWDWGSIKKLLSDDQFHLAKSEVLAGPDKGQRIIDPVFNNKHTVFCDIVLPVNKYLKQDLECIINHKEPKNLKQIVKINQDVINRLQEYHDSEVKEFRKTFNRLHQQFLEDD